MDNTYLHLRSNRFKFLEWRYKYIYKGLLNMWLRMGAKIIRNTLVGEYWSILLDI